MDKISRSALVDAALDLNKALELEPGVDVKLGAAALREGLIEAAMLLQPQDFAKLSAATRGVVDGLGEAIIAAVPRVRNDLIAALEEAGEDEAEIRRQVGGSEEDKIAEVRAVLDALRDRLGTNAQADEDDEADAIETVEPEPEPEPEVRRGVVMAAAKSKAAKPKVAKLKAAKAKAAKAKAAKLKPAAKLKVAKAKTVATPKMGQTNGGAIKKRYGDSDVITLRVRENPKKPSTAAHARFEKYRSGMTVAQFLAAGGSRGDLSWDNHPSRRFIEIIPAA